MHSKLSCSQSALNAWEFTRWDIPVFRTVIPTKLVDYLACGKPVLIGIRGQAQAIVEAAGAGLVFAPEVWLKSSMRLSG